MKMVIGRLQIPVLKAAMIDRDFFLVRPAPGAPPGGHAGRGLGGLGA
jgi:hypothetical protein